MSTADKEPREWKIWRDGSDQVVMGEDTYGEDVAVIERKAYDSLKAERDYWKTIAIDFKDSWKSAGAENERLKAELDERNKAVAHYEELLGFTSDKTKAENEQLKQELEEVKAKYDELKSYLPKVPTQPYEKELAEENERLRSELAEEKQISKSNLKISLIHQQKNIDYQARAEKLVDALKFYSDRKKWDEILMLEGAVFGNCEGDPAIVFDAEDDSPWEVAKNALADWGKK